MALDGCERPHRSNFAIRISKMNFLTPGTKEKLTGPW
jgi:hypothetical protein